MTTVPNPSPNIDELAKWLAEFEFGGNTEASSLRVTAVETIARETIVSNLEELVRLAFATKERPSASFVEKLRESFKNDPNFPSYGNDREMKVLAGMILSAIMRNPVGDLASLCALSVAAASMNGARQHDLPRDLSTEATNALDTLSNANRQRPDLTKVASSIPSQKIAAVSAINEIPAQLTPDALKAALTATVDAVQTTISNLGRRTNNVILAVEKFMAQQDEELQMLWWLVGGRSFKFDCDFKSIPAEAKPFSFAVDLAACTTVLPGPISIKALFSRAGLDDGKAIGLSQILTSVKTDQLKTLTQDTTISPVLHPLHFAIERQIEQGEGDGWVKAWTNKTGLPSDLSFTPLTLTVLLYREQLLLNAGRPKLL